MQFQNTGFHDNANGRAQPQQRGNTRDNNNREIGNRRNHGGGSNTGHANTVVAANGTSSPSVIIPAPTAPATTPPAPVTALPAPVTSHTPPTPYDAIESPPSGIGYSFLAGTGTPGRLEFTTTSDCEALSHFVDGHLIGDIESRIKVAVNTIVPRSPFLAFCTPKYRLL